MKLTREQRLERSLKIGKKNPEYFFLMLQYQNIHRNALSILGFMLFFICFAVYMDFFIIFLLALCFLLPFFKNHRDSKVVYKKIEEYRRNVK